MYSRHIITKKQLRAAKLFNLSSTTEIRESRYNVNVFGPAADVTRHALIIHKFKIILNRYSVYSLKLLAN